LIAVALFPEAVKDVLHSAPQSVLLLLVLGGKVPLLHLHVREGIVLLIAVAVAARLPRNVAGALLYLHLARLSELLIEFD
jgi:hypothetical protein